VNTRHLNRYSTHKSGEIEYVDSGHQVISLTEDLERGGILDPSLLEVVVENTLTISVSDTGAEYVDTEEWLSCSG